MVVRLELQVFLLVVFASAHIYSDPALWRLTRYGVVHGSLKFSQYGRPYEAYEGIPYAKPPIGKLRFEEPVPIEPWGWLNATENLPACTQIVEVPPALPGQNAQDDTIIGQEDCLYLHIYVPKRTRVDQKFPVIFFLHGGSFQLSSGSFFGAKYLMDYPLVFVSINYRLGSFGFLSTGDDIVPGNMGLKDQSLALEWVYDNIASFHGDNSRISLVGFSSGGTSVQYHYLSPRNRGKFSSGIAIGGVAFSPWAEVYDARDQTKKLASLVSCFKHDSKSMIECLKKVPAEKLVSANKGLRVWMHCPQAPFVPVIESCRGNYFICKRPEDIFRAREHHDVPILFTTVQNEGLSRTGEFALRPQILEDLDRNWNDVAPHLLAYNSSVPPNMKDQISRKIKQEYFAKSHLSLENFPALTQAMTDHNYRLYIEQAARLQAASSFSPVWVYFYSYRADNSYSDYLSRSRQDFGAAHGDDMNILVENTLVKFSQSPKDRRMQRLLATIWVTMAYTGIPQIGTNWPPLDPRNPEFRFLRIDGPKNYSMSGDRDFGRKHFWKTIPLTDMNYEI